MANLGKLKYFFCANFPVNNSLYEQTSIKLFNQTSRIGEPEIVFVKNVTVLEKTAIQCWGGLIYCLDYFKCIFDKVLD